MKIRKEDLLKLFISVLIFFVMWNFVFTMTKTSWVSLVYAFLVLILIIIVFIILEYRPHVVSFRLFLWLPFIILSIWGNIKLHNYEGCVYFIACLTLLFMAKQIDWNYVVPNEIFVVSGVWVAVGIIFQLVFSGIYNTYIATFFKNTNDIIYWSQGYGYAGFTYQLGVTAIILIYLEGIVLYGYENNEKVSAILALVITILVFLTGKRSLALLAILLPILVTVLCNKFSGKRILNILCVILVLGVILYFFIVNSDLFIKSKLLGRFASTIVDLENGRDVTSDRSELYKEALSMFRNNKILGIGLGNFKKSSFFATDVHNTYIQVLCEEGIVGEILFCVPLVVNLIFSVKENRIKQSKLLNLSLFLQLFFIIYGLTGNVMMNEICYVIYFFAISIVDGITRKNNVGEENFEKNRYFNISQSHK